MVGNVVGMLLLKEIFAAKIPVKSVSWTPRIRRSAKNAWMNKCSSMKVVATNQTLVQIPYGEIFKVKGVKFVQTLLLKYLMQINVI